MSFKEKDLTSAFAKYLKHNSPPFYSSTAIEFKVSKGSTINLTHDLQPQQLPCLIAAQHHFLYHKLSDMSQGFKPFDSFLLTNAQAFLAILFNPQPRTPKILHFFSINVVLALQLRDNKITIKDIPLASHSLTL